jgi:hypothetical protein
VGVLSLSQFEFDFLRGNYDLASARLGTKEAGNRTEVSPAPTTRRASMESLTRQEMPLFTMLSKSSQSGAATLQKIIIKFASKDPKTHHMVVASFDAFSTKRARAETNDRLEDWSLRVFLGIEFKSRDNFRRNPAGAYLAAGKVFLVHDDHFHSGLMQNAGAGGTRRSSANNENITRLHKHPLGLRLSHDKAPTQRGCRETFKEYHLAHPIFQSLSCALSEPSAV